jgi:pyridoxine 5-phosphate synthase
MRSSVRLGVNVDHLATLRQARRGAVPDPVEAARVCERAGASHIVCHLREDRRHIQDEDVRRLKATIAIPLNLEMSMAEEIVAVATAIRPHHVTLVPERRQELTTEGGLDVVQQAKRIHALLSAFGLCGVGVSLFIDPVSEQVQAARAIGGTKVELHTGAYANATTPSARQRELAALREAARMGKRLGLTIAAGHGLDYDNVREIAAIPEIEELNIGFSIIIRALSIGFEGAVREMAGLLTRRAPHALNAVSP